MASLNKVLLIGNLGRDPETRHMPSGGAVCNFSIATTDRWTDKDGQGQEKTEWHNITAYNKLAEICGQYLKKGSSIYVEGKLQTRQWEKDGVTRYTTEVIVSAMQMLGGKRQEDNCGHQEEAPPPSDKSKTADKKPAPSRNFDDFEDDIPF